MTSAALLNLVVIVLSLAPVIFALTYGGRAERMGGAIIGVGQLLTWTAQGLAEAASASAQIPLHAFMLIDLALALALGGVMVRHADKLWPGLAGCAQFLVFVFSLTRVIDFPLSERAFFIAVNLSSAAVLVALAAGTWASRWGRRKPSEWDIAAQNIALAR